MHVKCENQCGNVKTGPRRFLINIKAPAEGSLREGLYYAPRRYKEPGVETVGAHTVGAASSVHHTLHCPVPAYSRTKAHYDWVCWGGS